MVTTNVPAEGLSAKGHRPGADIAAHCCAAALGPRRLAHPEQRTCAATERCTLVGLRHRLDRP